MRAALARLTAARAEVDPWQASSLRLRAIQTSLDEVLAMSNAAAAGDADEMLQAVLLQHERALAQRDMMEAQAGASELQKQVAEAERQLKQLRRSRTAPSSQAKSQARGKRLAAAQEAAKALLQEAQELEAAADALEDGLLAAVGEGRLLEDEHRTAEAEVAKARRALLVLSCDATAARNVVPSRDGAAGGKSLDPEVYRRIREQGRMDADAALAVSQAARDEDIERLDRVQEASERDNEATQEAMDASLAELRQLLAERRSAVEASLTGQQAAASARVRAAEEQLAAELSALQARLSRERESLRVEAAVANRNQEEAIHGERVRLENRLAKARQSCSSRLAAEVARYRAAVVEGHRLLEEEQQRRQSLAKHVAKLKDGFRAHAQSCGAYVKSLDPERRRELEDILRQAPLS